MDLYARAAELGCSKAHSNLADIYHEGGDLKKAKFHNVAAAMAGRSLQMIFEKGMVSRDAIDSTFIAYNNSCADMRSKVRYAYIRLRIEPIGER